MFLSLSCIAFNARAYNLDNFGKARALSEKQNRGEAVTPEERDLSRMDLSGAPLYGANLHGANLEETNLSGAHLSSARLQNTNLQGTDLSEADITGINFCGAKLNAKTMLTPEQIAFAILSGATYYPDTTHD